MRDLPTIAPRDPLTLLKELRGMLSANNTALHIGADYKDMFDLIAEIDQRLAAGAEAETSVGDWPEYLMLRDTKLADDLGGLGQRIFTTAGAGYETRKYVRADLAGKALGGRDELLKALKAVVAIADRETDPFIHARALIAKYKTAPPAPAEEWRPKVAEAYGYLWHVNVAAECPHDVGRPPEVTPEQAAYKARRILRDLLTREEIGDALNAVRQRLLAEEAAPPSPPQAAARCIQHAAHHEHWEDSEPSPPSGCQWSSDDDGVWHSGCGNSWIFSDGDPAENDCAFCMFCGDRLDATSSEQPKEADSEQL